jgi:CRISPR-associated endoribonuclease Cas6
MQFDPVQVAYARARTAEAVDFGRAIIVPDPDPVMTGQNAIGVVMLSPLAISRDDRAGKGPRWYSSLDGLDLAGAVNKRLSRLANRPIHLSIEPDRLYLRTRPRYDTLVRVKEGQGGKVAFVIGMLVPLVLSGSEEDLKFAWYSGLGEKNRGGFGAIGLAERGIGR